MLIKPPAYIPVNRAHPLMKDCRLYLPLNEGKGSAVNDLSGNVGINPSVSAQLDGSSMLFYRSFPESSITGDMTIYVWVNPDPIVMAGHFMAIAAKYGSAGDRDYMLALNTDGKVAFWNSDDGTNTVYDTTSNYVSPGILSFIALVYDASAGTAEVYLNGVSVDTLTGLDTSIHDGSADFMIGAFVSPASPSYAFGGMIKNVAIFDDIRSAGEITADYQSRFNTNLSGEGNLIGQWLFDEDGDAEYIDNKQGDAGRDLIPYSGGDVTFAEAGRTTGGSSSVNGIIDGATWTSNERGWVLDFDGTDDRISFPPIHSLSFPNNSPMTIIVSIERDTAAGGIIDKYNPTGYEFLLAIGGTNQIVFWVYDNVNKGYRGRRAPIFGTGAYHQVAAVYDGGTTAAACKIYVDGLQVDNTDFTGGTFVTMRKTETPVNIGFANTGVNVDLNGRIEYLGMWAREFSQQEIQSLYAEPYQVFRS